MENSQKWIYTAIAGIICLSCITSIVRYFHTTTSSVEDVKFRIRACQVEQKDFPIWITTHATVGSASVLPIYAPSGTVKLIFWESNPQIKANEVIAVFEDQQGRSFNGLKEIVDFKKQQLDRQREIYTEDASHTIKDPKQLDAYVNGIAAVGNAHQEYQKAMQELKSYQAQCIVYANTDGILSIPKMPVGSSVQNGQLIGEFVQNTNNPVVEAYIKEEDIHSIQEGNAAIFILPGTDKSYSGYISAIDPMVDKEHCGIKVSVTLNDIQFNNNSKTSFYPKQTGTLRICSKTIKSILVIPTLSLMDLGNQYIVSVIHNYNPHTREGYARYASVGTDKSLESYGWTPVVGLEPGTIISTNILYQDPQKSYPLGMPVHIIEGLEHLDVPLTEDHIAELDSDEEDDKDTNIIAMDNDVELHKDDESEAFNV